MSKYLAVVVALAACGGGDVRAAGADTTAVTGAVPTRVDTTIRTDTVYVAGDTAKGR